MRSHSVISIDLAKNVFQVSLVNEHNKVIFNKKTSRANWVKMVLNLGCQRIVMAACYSPIFGVGNSSRGDTSLIWSRYTRLNFVVGNKNDHNDAIAIAEAAKRPKARFVRVKTLEQRDVQSSDRIRDRLLNHEPQSPISYEVCSPNMAWSLRKALRAFEKKFLFY